MRTREGAGEREDDGSSRSGVEQRKKERRCDLASFFLANLKKEKKLAHQRPRHRRVDDHRHRDPRLRQRPRHLQARLVGPALRDHHRELVPARRGAAEQSQDHAGVAVGEKRRARPDESGAEVGDGGAGSGGGGGEVVAALFFFFFFLFGKSGG